MSVYVDELQSTKPYKNTKFRRSQFCHLIADSAQELHDFALDVLHLKFEWFSGGRLPHYDLSPGMRRIAVEKGAIEITGRQMIAILKKEQVK